MFSARADPERQRMDIACDQALEPEDVQRLIESLKHEAAKLRPGWTAAVDFRGMWVNNPFANEQFRLLQDALIANGVGKIGTLLDSDPLKMRLWQSGTQTHSNEMTRRFHSPEEWEAFLSGS